MHGGVQGMSGPFTMKKIDKIIKGGNGLEYPLHADILFIGGNGNTNKLIFLFCFNLKISFWICLLQFLSRD